MMENKTTTTTVLPVNRTYKLYLFVPGHRAIRECISEDTGWRRER